MKGKPLVEVLGKRKSLTREQRQEVRAKMFDVKLVKAAVSDGWSANWDAYYNGTYIGSTQRTWKRGGGLKNWQLTFYWPMPKLNHPYNICRDTREDAIRCLLAHQLFGILL